MPIEPHFQMRYMTSGSVIEENLGIPFLKPAVPAERQTTREALEWSPIQADVSKVVDVSKLTATESFKITSSSKNPTRKCKARPQITEFCVITI